MYAAIIISHFFILICCFYCYCRILNLNDLFLRSRILYTLSALIIACGLCFIHSMIYPVAMFLVLFVFYIFITLFTKTDWSTSLNATIISIAMSLVSFTISSFVFSTLVFFMYSYININNLVVIKLLNGFLQYFIIHIPFQFKRLKKGMPFLYELQLNNIGTCISLLILICYVTASISNTTENNYLPFIIPLFLIFPCALLLILWWRAIITRNYRRKLQQFEMQKLKNELIQKEQEITRLLENNNALAQIIHRDNKLIPAMELAVNTFLQNRNTLSPQQLKEQGFALAAHLQTISQERKFNLTEYQTNGQPLASTGICAVDAVLQLMQQRALQEQIDYTLRIAENIKTTAMQSLSEEDFSNLLADLIENAFIAMSDVPDKKILINLGRMGNHLSVEISDNGQPFSPEIFQDFGLKAHTTHAGNGGSGIGLMDIWKLKKKYRASLVITEYAPGTYSYTKQISLIFDAKKHYIIQTYRRRELGQIRFRDDLYIFPC